MGDIVPNDAPRPGLVVARPQLAGSADDQALLDLWVRSKRKSAHTRATYTRHGARLLAWLAARNLGLRTLSLDVLLQFAESLADLSTGTQKNILAATKSLLTFGQKSGYLAFNVGAALELSQPKNTLAERILSEEQVQRMLAMEADPFRHLLIRVLYSSGGRVSEVLGARWRDTAPNGDTGQLTLLGKGGETRVVKLSPATWAELHARRPANAGPDTPLFATKQGKSIARSWAWAIVKAAAKRAGLPADVSPHWMRHAHASHALDRGAPAHLVQTTLGHASLATTTKYAHARPAESSADYLAL